MGGDFSRNTFAKQKHYSKVLMQQGRVQLDSDFNEQQHIIQHLEETKSRDIIGPSGVPKTIEALKSNEILAGNNFQILLTQNSDNQNADDLKISKGRIYVDGILCENERDDTTLRKQDDSYKYENGLPVDGVYVVYLDVWQREITAIDDPEILEKALGGCDTSIRTKTLWQVKLEKVSEEFDCSKISHDWKPNHASEYALQPGKLKAKIKDNSTTRSPFNFSDNDTYNAVENQLYRVEIHNGGSRDIATFKWSRDNASFVVPIESASGRTITLKNINFLDQHTLEVGQWVEIVTDKTVLDADLDCACGNMVKITKVNSNYEIEVDGNIPDETKNESNEFHPKLVVWNHNYIDSGDIPIKGNELSELEKNIQIEFSDGIYMPGDYWLIPARTATGDIEWPDSEMKLPDGIQHHYCALALVVLENGNFTSVNDCRKEFPSITSITASDVSFDNTTCNLVALPETTTVQEALRAICGCHEDVGHTLMAFPRQGWEKIFDCIGDKEDARICFHPGEYTVDRTIELRNKGNILISGCGAGTKITALNSESVFMFDCCDSVTVQNVYLSSETTGHGNIEQTTHLNGTITFCACKKVTVDNVEIKCAAGAEKEASCIYVRDAVECERNKSANKNDITPVSLVNIRNCDLHIGYLQVGILLINISRAVIENNVLGVARKPNRLTMPVLLQNTNYRKIVRNLLIQVFSSENQETSGSIEKVKTNSATVPISIGKESISFKTDHKLVNSWKKVISDYSLNDIQTSHEFISYTKKITDAVLLNEGKLKIGDIESYVFVDWYNEFIKENPSIASQGIVVAGCIAKDIHILNNKISSVMQGIHIGTSHNGGKENNYDCAGLVHIINNNIEIQVSFLESDSHGIFTGNTDNLLVENNYILFKYVKDKTPSGIFISGIRVHGYLGRMMIIRQNHLVNVKKTGIKITILNENTKLNQWIVTDNIAPNAAEHVKIIPQNSDLVRGLETNYN